MDNERLSPVMVMVIVLAVLGFMGFVIYVLEYHWKTRRDSNLDPVRNQIAEEAHIATGQNHVKSQEQEAKAQKAGQYV